jgi:Protein of unknown function (DUF2752)
MTNDTPPILRPVRLQPQGYSAWGCVFWMLGGLSILLLAATMSVGEMGRVYLPAISVPVPETCTTRYRFGISCPGCGMTRAFIHFAHGRFTDGLQLNPIALLVFVFVGVQIPAGMFSLWRGRNSREAVLWARLNEISLIMLPALTFAQWLIRFAVGV